MGAVRIFFFVLFGIIIIPFTFLILKLISNAKKSSWSGTVIEKGHNTKRDFDTDRIEHFYFLKVKMEDGNIRNIGLSKEMCDKFEVGDKIKKDSGELYPKKA
jgi:hypothetical protein